jgi:putative membrane protein
VIASINLLAEIPSLQQLKYFSFRLFGYCRKSANNAVKAFANAVLRDYTAANKLTASSLAKLNINLQDNAVSQSLAGAGAEHAQDLSKLSGAAFDKAYAQSELAYHVFVTGALETTLIPSP